LTSDVDNFASNVWRLSAQLSMERCDEGRVRKFGHAPGYKAKDTRGQKPAPIFDSENRHGRK